MTTATADQAATERAPTYDLPAEQVLLGILMTHPDAVSKVADLDAEKFYRPQNGEIFDAILRLHADGKPTEPGAVTALLADEGTIKRLGGMEYLADCYRSVPTVANIGYYVERILEMAQRRAYEAAGIRLTSAATTAGRAPGDIAALAQELVDSAQIRRQDLHMHQLGSLINPCLDDIEVRRHKPKGIKTGFTDLDKVIGGMAPKQLITIAGPTSSGKSVFVTDLARRVAIKDRMTVAFFSLEMAKEEIFDRVIAAEASVPHTAVRDGTLTEADWAKVTAKLGPMSNAPLFIADEGNMTVADIAARSRRLRDRHGLDLVVVDHMHLVTPSRRNLDEKGMADEISRDLKKLAMDLGRPVVVAAQMNRNPSIRADKKPQLTDLKNSSSIEQNSNIVLMLHREEYYDKSSPRQGELDVVVAKNRGGETRDVQLAAQLHLSRFVDMAKD